MPSNSSPHHDGWHVVKWLKGLNDTYQLAVCDRRKLSIFSPAGEEVKSPNINLGPPRDGAWILDLKSSYNNSNLVVLTSTHILSIFGQFHTFHSHSKCTPLEASPVWAHFRDALDPTMQLSLAEFFDGMLLTSNGFDGLLTHIRYVSATLLSPQQHRQCLPSRSFGSPSGLGVPLGSSRFSSSNIN